jgi:hypothetical protein
MAQGGRWWSFAPVQVAVRVGRVLGIGPGPRHGHGVVAPDLVVPLVTVVVAAEEIEPGRRRVDHAAGMVGHLVGSGTRAARQAHPGARLLPEQERAQGSQWSAGLPGGGPMRRHLKAVNGTKYQQEAQRAPDRVHRDASFASVTVFSGWSTRAAQNSSPQAQPSPRTILAAGRGGRSHRLHQLPDLPAERPTACAIIAHRSHFVDANELALIGYCVSYGDRQKWKRREHATRDKPPAAIRRESSG